MVQLIINGVEYPETSHDKYTAYTRFEGEDLRMISGRSVTELSYRIWVVEYSYDYFKNSDVNRILQDLRRGNTVEASFLPPGKDERISDAFKCTKYPMPTFAFSRGDKSFWHQISFTLEGVNGIA